ncbi:hypothetical protein VTN02DRAFT_205 [Thermoascus thermophilus]
MMILHCCAFPYLLSNNAVTEPLSQETLPDISDGTPRKEERNKKLKQTPAAPLVEPGDGLGHQELVQARRASEPTEAAPLDASVRQGWLVVDGGRVDVHRPAVR